MFASSVVVCVRIILRQFFLNDFFGFEAKSMTPIFMTPFRSLKSFGLVAGLRTCRGNKGPSALSNLNTLPCGFGLVVGLWTCNGAVDS